ncbi:MAG: hypothetical protein COA79_26605 [Planctomycetota bacterium]|nr:MAG: hypothetical protein COA79_26605 [Planctomycetota bacterium]
MTIARKDLINENEVGTYHITNRCVRHCWLLENPHDPDRDYSHRKKWFYDALEKFADIFCIDIGGYAIMSNHYHLVLRNRPDLREKLSDNDLAFRWLSLHPTAESKREKRSKPTKLEISIFLESPENLKKCKENLSCISTFMKRLNQPIARRANKEENITGRFWEGRFHSQYLADEVAVLSCMTYVDLNPIRAQITNDLSESKYTSAYDRTHSAMAKENIKEFKKLNEKAMKNITYKQYEAVKYQYSIANSSNWISKIQRNETENTKPFLRMQLKDYLELLDYTGREIRADKPGYIPNRIPTILETMDVNHKEWINQINHYGKWYFRVVGQASKIKNKLKDTSQKWFQGIKNSDDLYISSKISKN